MNVPEFLLYDISLFVTKIIDAEGKRFGDEGFHHEIQLCIMT
jgi:hypothetical protein